MQVFRSLRVDRERDCLIACCMKLELENIFRCKFCNGLFECRITLFTGRAHVNVKQICKLIHTSLFSFVSEKEPENETVENSGFPTCFVHGFKRVYLYCSLSPKMICYALSRHLISMVT
jgi:hypothetical protein